VLPHAPDAIWMHAIHLITFKFTRRTMNRKIVNDVSVFTLALALVFSVMSCGQYDYSSPNPGILEIHLKTKNSRTDFLPFSDRSFFLFNLKSLEAFTVSGGRLPVLPDLNAIRRSTDGDFFNTLDTLARDSSLILGKVYAPPGTYNRIEMVASIISPSFVVVPNVGTLTRQIEVEQPLPLPDALKTLPRAGGTMSFTVAEGRVTRVNVMIDLDTTLVRQTESYLGQLQFYVSSIQNY
jgi:hypothetical protein